MPLLQWSNELSVGVQMIDTQHQVLIARIDALMRAMEQGRGQDEVVRMFRFLEEYTSIHFNAEETIMLKKGYPAYPEHKAMHEAFVAQVATLRQQAEAALFP